jgi:hypothetical protein
MKVIGLKVGRRWEKLKGEFTASSDERSIPLSGLIALQITFDYGMRYLNLSKELF